MKRATLVVKLVAILLVAVACNSHQKDEDAIRASIVQYLNSLGSLRVSSMALKVTQVTIDGTRARAQVEFRPGQKDAPSGVVMQVAYTLEKRDGAWVVLGSQSISGEMEHPKGGQMPGDMSSPGALPPGHPPVNPSTQSPGPAEAAKPN